VAAVLSKMGYRILVPHISDDELDLYALERLPEDQSAALEEHLLWCHACLDTAEEAQD